MFRDELEGNIIQAIFVAFLTEDKINDLTLVLTGSLYLATIGSHALTALFPVFIALRSVRPLKKDRL